MLSNSSRMLDFDVGETANILRRFGHDRKQLGQAIGEFQLMQAKLGAMYAIMSAAKSCVYTVAKACDRGQTA